ncbi:MAG: hypothetical protein COT74_11650 [Bdellovibrionales bacterium CG10_big_fil_rev_8_21_14_0_10_45_34]|nr:MAG: hypothetical protein COT74_11650 [Bdellovibrionales bacterium CG10_big_fil_rev_8_21_14_0_10_45_34]
MPEYLDLFSWCFSMAPLLRTKLGCRALVATSGKKLEVLRFGAPAWLKTGDKNQAGFVNKKDWDDLPN